MKPNPYTAAEIDRWLNIGASPASGGPARIGTTPRDGAGTTIPNMIPEGKRNSTLTSHAGALRRRGLSQTAIAAALQQANSEQCEPPLPPDEVEGIALSISQYAPTDPHFVLQSMNDTGNARRLVERHGSTIRFVPQWKRWIRWNGRFWEGDNRGQLIELAKDVAMSLYDDAAAQDDDTLRSKLSLHASRSLHQQRLQAMVNLASSDPRVVIDAAQLDARDMLLGVQNGVIDLETGLLSEHRPEHYITRIAPIDFDASAKAPGFEKFLDDITEGDVAQKRYLLRLLGYCLTGLVTEQKLFFFFGTGANGKTTFLCVIQLLMGEELVKQTPSDTLMARPHGRSATNDLARLAGARVTLSSEVEDGSFLAESQIKQMTGGDAIPARFLYGEFFEFRPKFKLIIAGNHKPIVRGDDDGIWRRLHLVPFMAFIPEEKRDPHLLDKLRLELSGILNLAIAGCLQWQRAGLQPPDVVVKASNDYRSEMDILGQWIADEATVEPSASWRAADAYFSYKMWAESNGFRAMTNASFGRKIKERYQAVRDKHGVTYAGIGPKVKPGAGVRLVV